MIAPPPLHVKRLCVERQRRRRVSGIVSTFHGWWVSHVLALKEHVNLAERRPLHLDAVPALDHQVVDLSRAVGRLREHSVQLVSGAAAATVVHHLVICERFEWTLAGERQDFPQSHSKRPNVALARELVLHRNMQRTYTCQYYGTYTGWTKK